MAKVTHPLLSASASGSLKSRLTFSKRSTGQQVRFQRGQVVPTATDSQTQRAFFEEAVTQWLTLNSGERQQWHDFVNGA